MSQRTGWEDLGLDKLLQIEPPMFRQLRLLSEEAHQAFVDPAVVIFSTSIRIIKCEIISWWTVGIYCLLQSIEPDQPDAPGKSKKTSNRWSRAALRSGARALVRGVSGTTQWCSWCPWFWNQDHFWLQHYSLLIICHVRVPYDYDDSLASPSWMESKTYHGRYCSWWLSCWREWYPYIWLHSAAD